MEKIKLEEIIYEAALLKEEIAKQQAELRDLSKQIADSVVFSDGKKTAHVEGLNGCTATIQLKETVSWDQEILNAVRNKVGDENFFKVFGWEFKPRSKKELDGCLAYSGFGDLVRKAMTVKEASPYVTFKMDV